MSGDGDGEYERLHRDELQLVEPLIHDPVLDPLIAALAGQSNEARAAAAARARAKKAAEPEGRAFTTGGGPDPGPSGAPPPLPPPPGAPPPQASGLHNWSALAAAPEPPAALPDVGSDDELASWLPPRE